MSPHRLLRFAAGTKPSTAVAWLREYELCSVEGIADATRMLERAMPDYVRPAAHGFGVIKASGEVIAAVINQAGHDLPAMLLAAICGHRQGTEVVAFSVEQIELAIAAMAPAESCSAFKHPNIAAWRWVLGELYHGDTAIAVFVDDEWMSSLAKPIVQAFMQRQRQHNRGVSSGT